MWKYLRMFLRLTPLNQSLKCPTFTVLFSWGIDIVTVHRRKKTIHGRQYLIEVQSLDTNRWRADLVRPSGRSTALMPFYGATPDEAVLQLSSWLALAHSAAADTA